MPNRLLFSTHQTLIRAWVKNVYNLCVHRVLTRVQPSTALLTTLTQAVRLRVQPQLIPKLTNSFAPYSYTALFSPLPLVNTHLYTVSTAPTIKKNKKK